MYCSVVFQEPSLFLTPMSKPRSPMAVTWVAVASSVAKRADEKCIFLFFFLSCLKVFL